MDTNTVSTETEDCCTSIDYNYFIADVRIIAAVDNLYFAYKHDKREVNEVSAVNTANMKLDNFD